MSKDNNFLLTVLGAVGIGALMMGLNQQDKGDDIQENYDGMTSFGFQRVRERVAVGKDGCMRAVNFAQPRPGSEQINQQISTLVKSGASKAQIKAELADISAERTDQLKQRIAQSTARNLQGKKAVPQKVMKRLQKMSAPRPTSASSESYENYESEPQMFESENSMGLGAGTVTEPYYVSYPQFQQTVPQRSPSLNLGRDIRYNPPSTDRMGISEAYQNLPQNLYNGGTQVQQMGPSNSVTEHYDMISENYAAEPAQAKFFANAAQYEALGPAYVANKDSMIKAVSTGNADFADESQTIVAPLTCNEGCDENANALIPLGPGAEDNVQIFDRVITVPLKAGWRQQPNGGVDRIRGDLPVCVDPCQAGWFQSSLKPQFLTIGALNNGTIANSDVGKFVESVGGQMVKPPSSGITAQEMKIMAAPDASRVVQTGGFM